MHYHTLYNTNNFTLFINSRDFSSAVSYGETHIKKKSMTLKNEASKQEHVQPRTALSLRKLRAE